MEKLQHTPGPWIADTYAGIVSESLYVTSPKGIIIGVGQYDISGTGKETASKKESEANGRLIAAAPDLLTALIHARNVIKTWHNLSGEDDDDETWRIYEKNAPEMHLINSAVLKATRS